jgi:hypothetical protein
MPDFFDFWDEIEDAIEWWIKWHLLRRLRRISLTLFVWQGHYWEGGEEGMQLNVNTGDTVVAQLDGHSASNGAPIPENSTIAMSSNDPAVATVPATVTVPAGGAVTIGQIPVTILAAGSTDITHNTTTPDGTQYTASATLVVTQVVPGLLSISLTLIQTNVTPPPTPTPTPGP